MSHLPSCAVLTEIALGVMAADLIIGAVHWLEDNYASVNSKVPFIRSVAVDNEMHHYFPRDILAFTHLEHMQVTSVVTAAVLGTVCLLAPAHFKRHLVFYVTLGAVSLFANVIHRFLHERDHERNGFVTLLQKVRVLSSREQHQAHHRLGGINYCIITPWLNPILDGLGVWRRLEQAIEVFLGIRAYPKLPYDGYAAIRTHHHDMAATDTPPRVSRQTVAELKQLLLQHLQTQVRPI